MNDAPANIPPRHPLGQKVAIALLLVIVIGSPLAYWASDGRFPVMPSKTKAVQIPQPVQHREWSQQPTRPPCADGWDQSALDGLCFPSGYLPLKEQLARRCSPETVKSDQALAIECLLRSWVRDLQDSQKEVAAKVETVERQLASEQIELKLLSNQLGALAGRVDNLSAESAAKANSAQPKKPRGQ